MLSDIWTKSLWDHRRAIVGWAIGLAAVSLVYGGFFPFAATPEYAELVEGLPSGLADAFGWNEISTAHGYLGSTVFGMLGPVLVIIMAIGFGARAIAGSEEDGSLELLIAQPVTRVAVVTQKAVALVVLTAVAGLVVFLAVLAINSPVELNLPVARIGAVSLNLALLGGVFGTMALAVGAFVGRRGVVIGVTTVVAVAAFLMNGLAPQVEAVAWLQNASPFYWFAGTSTLRDGLDLSLTGLLAVAIVGFVLVAVWAFNRRDIGVG